MRAMHASHCAAPHTSRVLQGRGRDARQGIGPGMFFIQVLLVSPNRFRPFNEVNGMKTEHEHNVLYQKILKASLDIHDLRSRRCAPPPVCMYACMLLCSALWRTRGRPRAPVATCCLRSTPYRSICKA